MKNQKTASPNRTTLFILGLALLVMAMPMQALAAQNITQASVAFTDGELEIGGIVGGSGMNLEFGTHPIPVAAITYPAENVVDHILGVEDSRVTSGDWHVTVALTQFSGASSGSFDGVVTLVNPAVANTNTSAGTDGLTVQNTIAVTSGLGEKLVMAADATLPRGLFTATWTNEQVTLGISHEQVTNVTEDAYTATMTWTVNLGPY